MNILITKYFKGFFFFWNVDNTFYFFSNNIFWDNSFDYNCYESYVNLCLKNINLSVHVIELWGILPILKIYSHCSTFSNNGICVRGTPYIIINDIIRIFESREFVKRFRLSKKNLYNNLSYTCSYLRLFSSHNEQW